MDRRATRRLRSHHNTMVSPKRLLIVAGPSCVGKSHLLEKLQEGELPMLATSLGLAPVSSWEFYNANELNRPTDLPAGNTALHYDLLRPRFAGFGNYHNDPVLKILDAAQEITVLTMWDEPEILLGRFDQRIQGKLLRIYVPVRLFGLLRNFPKLIKKRNCYRQTPELWRQYTLWFEFCAGYDLIEHWILRNSTQFSLSKLSDWPDARPFWATSSPGALSTPKPD